MKLSDFTGATCMIAPTSAASGCDHIPPADTFVGRVADLLGKEVAYCLMHLCFRGGLPDLDVTDTRTFNSDTLDSIALGRSAANVVSGSLIFEHCNWVATSVRNQQVAPLAIYGAMRLLRLPIQRRMCAYDLPKADLRKHIIRIRTGRQGLSSDIQGGAEEGVFAAAHDPGLRKGHVLPRDRFKLQVE